MKHPDLASWQGKPSFQPCKLYIKILAKTKHLDELEKELTSYFFSFGRIDDLRILKNSFLNRRLQSLRLCVFQGRSRSSRSPLSTPFHQKRRSPLISSSSLEPLNQSAKTTPLSTSPATKSSLGEFLFPLLSRNSTITFHNSDKSLLIFSQPTKKTPKLTEGMASSSTPPKRLLVKFSHTTKIMFLELRQ